MPKKNLNCTKCQQILNHLPYHSYAEPPALKSKEGQFYCFNCFKSISCCKICNKSVAKMDIDIHDKKTWYQPWEKIYWREAGHIKPFDMCGRYCDFFCSPKCLAQDDNRNHEIRMKKNQTKLAQGWKYCEKCLEIYDDFYAEFKFDKKYHEQIISNCANLVSSVEKTCGFHKRQQEKDHYVNQVIYPKAQKWWNSLTYEKKLAKVKKLDIHWIATGKRFATHEEVASQKEVPPFIISQKFQHEEPCISCGKIWKCDGETNCGKNSPNGKISYCASCPPSTGSNGNSAENNTKDNHNGFINEIESKKNQLQRLKENKEENSEEIHKLEQEIKMLLQMQDQKSSSTSRNPMKNNLIIGFALLFLIGSIIYISKVIKPKKPKIK